MGAKEFRAYVKALNNASLLAQRELSELWERMDPEKPEAVRDALIAFVPGIIYRYGDMAALAAAQYYEKERFEALGDEDFAAELADEIPLEQIEASIRFACGHLFPKEENGIRSEQDSGLPGGDHR